MSDHPLKHLTLGEIVAQILNPLKAVASNKKFKDRLINRRRCDASRLSEPEHIQPTHEPSDNR